MGNMIGHKLCELFKMAAETSAANDICHVEGLTNEVIVVRYSNWGAQYDMDMGEEHFKGPIIAAQAIQDLFPQSAQRSDVDILDVAAGTGFAGERLKQIGFTKLDALEPSEGMLAVAKSKNIYNRRFQDFLNENPTSIESDHYDVALICGGMGQGHIPCSGLDELIRVVKPGGFVVIVMREQYLDTVDEYKDRLEPQMKRLEVNGKWKSVSRTVVPKYSWDNDGVVYVFKVEA